MKAPLRCPDNGAWRLAAAWLLFLSGCSDDNRDFRDAMVLSGLDNPTSFRFTRSGGLFVTEQAGLLKFFPSLGAGSELVADLRTQVYSFWDRGLLDLELDPEFPSAPFLYVLYTYDAPIGGTAPVYKDQDNRPQSGAASGRLSRLRLAPSAASFTLAEETVLVNDWCQVYPSHSLGTLRFGSDGALYASAGEGASFKEADWGQLQNFCPDPPLQGGALRAQRSQSGAGPPTLDGALIRVSAQTGAALPDNPLSSAGPGIDARIIAYGLRNPYRFTLRPGSREIWIADVGWNTWEEVDRVIDPGSAQDFGWPCLEGPARTPGFETACGTLHTADVQRKIFSPPYLSYRHHAAADATMPCGGGDAAVTGIAFYDGDSYPQRFAGALMLADYARGCIWALLPGGDGLPDPGRSSVLTRKAKAPISLQVGPGGDLYYLAYEKGQLRRLSYASGASMDEEVGPSPHDPVATIAMPDQDIAAAARSAVAFAGSATDEHGSALPRDALDWRVIIHHCSDQDTSDCHTHNYTDIQGVDRGSFIMPDDHTAPSYLELQLRATVTLQGARYTGTTARKVRYLP